MKRPPIRVHDLAGTSEQMGKAHGSAFAEEIRHYTNHRIDLVAGGSWSGGPIPRADVLAIAESMVDAHRDFDADLHTEMCAMAAAAGITAAEAIVGGGFTDFVDTVRATVGGGLPASVTEDDCTSVIVPDGRAAGAGFFAQTWDMHDTATDHVVLLRVAPDNGPDAVVFTTTGCLGQIGMNSEGVAVGINNLTALDGQPGVTWPTVVRAMLKTSTAAEALSVLQSADLAGAHNYLIFDRHGAGYNVEAMPSVQVVTELSDQPIVHTNHTVAAEATDRQADRDPVLMSSSTARLDTAADMLAEGTVDTDRLVELTREPSAICQVPVDPYRIESSGAAIMRPATGEFWACWGLPSENEFEPIAFPAVDG